ncbi:hypothetical protein DFH08DRAFT_821655 [Mycena albidolilacea]|uniref:Uncharacterized protein n=1 Tax=Mycena albidolilacea TaxID=1033008 RepID=A0AAD7ED55_9AGAR|nr:hypothetical protein DFH08DRAFT_821655 [Mycena albidolilacea]
MNLKNSLFGLVAFAGAARASVVACTEETAANVPTPWKSSGIEFSNSTGLLPRTGAELVTCYNEDTQANRAPIIAVIGDFCSQVIGITINNGATVYNRYSYGYYTVLVSAEAIDGLTGPNLFLFPAVPYGNCGRLLRLPVDQCDTSGENGKHGGFETDACGQWRVDPGGDGSDY